MNSTFPFHMPLMMCCCGYCCSFPGLIKLSNNIISTDRLFCYCYFTIKWHGGVEGWISGFDVTEERKIAMTLMNMILFPVNFVRQMESLDLIIFENRL